MKVNKEIKIGFLAIIGIMMSVFSYNYLKGINLFEKNIPGLSLSLDKTEIEDNESAIKLLSDVLKKLKSSNNK